MDWVRGTAVAAALLLLASCGNPPVVTPIASSSPSPEVTPSAVPSAPADFPSPTPGGPTPPARAALTCSSQVPATASLALVKLRNTAGVIVRDITDLSKPVSRCVIAGSAANFFKFVNATHISYIVTSNDTGALYLVNLLTRTTSLVRAWTNEGSLYWVYSWSPDGKSLSYLRSNGDKVEWHLLSAAGDVKLSDLGSIPGRGVDPNSDDAMVGFSADGKYVALENTFSNSTGAAGQAPPFQVIRISDKKLLYSRTAATMAVWRVVGETLYFRTTAGVEYWDAEHGSHVVVPQGFRWIHPWASRDGKWIAYVDADSKGNHFPGYVSLASEQAFRVSSRPATGAGFLNARLMWYAGESVCSSQCGLGEPKLNGKTYIYDVVAKTESVSIITALLDSWPHLP